MILILLVALIKQATADPDYFAVKIRAGRYKIFTKLSHCTEAVYQSGDNRVLFQDEGDRVWKIGALKNDLDCNTLPSVVEVKYWTKGTQMPKLQCYVCS